MQQDILTPVPTGKVYKIQHIIVAGFFGGMFASAYLLAGNFKTFGLKQKVFSTWIYAVILFLLLGCVSLVPELDRIPGIVYTIVITAIIAAYANAQQKNLVEEHIANGGEVHSGWRVFFVALIGLLLMVAFVLLIYLLTDMFVSGEGELEGY